MKCKELELKKIVFFSKYDKDRSSDKKDVIIDRFIYKAF